MGRFDFDALAAMAKVGSAVGSLERASGPVAWALEP